MFIHFVSHIKPILTYFLFKIFSGVKTELAAVQEKLNGTLQSETSTRNQLQTEKSKLVALTRKQQIQLEGDTLKLY